MGQCVRYAPSVSNSGGSGKTMGEMIVPDLVPDAGLVPGR